jgi:acetyl esterase/lipase
LRLRLPGVERIADLPYGDAGVRNLLDLYRPTPSPGNVPMPIFLWIHGGAWITGNKTQQGVPLMYGMADRGWLVASMNYRLAPLHRFPDPLVDVKRAIAWLRAHAATYGADPNCIVAAGGSAGAHLAVLAALTPNQPEYQPGFAAADTSLAAVVSLYGRFDFTDRSNVLGDKHQLMKFLGDKVMPCHYADNAAIWDRASPIAQVGPHAPPVLVMHGTHDSLIPIAEATAFVAALRAVSKQAVVYAPMAGAQHAWDLFNTPWTQHGIFAIDCFCEMVRKSAS